MILKQIGELLEDGDHQWSWCSKCDKKTIHRHQFYKMPKKQCLECEEEHAQNAVKEK